MNAVAEMPVVSTKMLWAGRVVSAVPAFLVLAGAIPKVLKLAPIVAAFRQNGFPENLVVPIGIIELVCAVVYLIPRTRVLGAILMTGLLGGAIVTNLRVGNPALIAPLILGIMVWGGLFLATNVCVLYSDVQLAIEEVGANDVAAVRDCPELCPVSTAFRQLCAVSRSLDRYSPAAQRGDRPRPRCHPREGWDRR